MQRSITLQSGTTIHYWTYNTQNKPTILVVHGFRGTHHGLEKIIHELRDYHFVVPDLPGFGESDNLKAPHTIENYANAMHKLIRVAKLPKDTIYLGHSMGASIVSAMLSSEDTTRTAILINPVCDSPTRGLGVIKIFPGILYHHLAGRYLPEKLGNAVLTNKWLFLIGSSTMTMTKDRQLRNWIHWNHITYMKQFNDRTSLLEAYDSSCTTTVKNFTKYLNQHRILMISGQKDSITSIKAARALASKLPDATFVELPDVGHIVHYEKAAEAAQAIKAFLSRRRS